MIPKLGTWSRETGLKFCLNLSTNKSISESHLLIYHFSFPFFFFLPVEVWIKLSWFLQIPLEFQKVRRMTTQRHGDRKHLSFTGHTIYADLHLSEII